MLTLNNLMRSLEPSKAEYQTVRAAIEKAFREGYLLYVVRQMLMEFWVVATRPVAVNGLGITPDKALQILSEIQKDYILYRNTEGKSP